MNYFIGFCVGVVCLFVVTVLIELSVLSIDEISGEITSQPGTYVLNGEILSVQSHAAVSFLTVENCQAVDVVVFDNITLSEKDFVQIRGSVRTFQNEAQFIAESIIVRSLRVE